MKATIEKVSAITLEVEHIEKSFRFYQDVLGLELLYGGPSAAFRRLGAKFEKMIVDVHATSPSS